MDNTAILQEMLRYIDSHIKEKMNIEILAERAGFSPVYFCRMFQNGVGTSIMEYVRNRRLAYAASELNSGRKLHNIALDYGFDTHSGFSKAFRRLFGCSPEVYRTYANFKVPEIPDLSKVNQFDSGTIIEPKIMANKQAFKIAGFLHPYNNKSLKSNNVYNFKMECTNDGRMEKLHSQSFIKYNAEYGVVFPDKNDEDISIYVIGLEVNSKQKINPEYTVFDIPESLYAVFSTNPTIEDTWQYIFSEWLPNSGYRYNDCGVPFEFFDGRSITDSICDIYLPVVKYQL